MTDMEKTLQREGQKVDRQFWKLLAKHEAGMCHGTSFLPTPSAALEAATKPASGLFHTPVEQVFWVFKCKVAIGIVLDSIVVWLHVQKWIEAICSLCIFLVKVLSE